MPEVERVGTRTERAQLRAAVADTHARATELLEEFRVQRERFVRTSESLAVERRLLREDHAHWKDERA